MVSLRARQGSRVRPEINDTIVSRLAEQDTVFWYKKPNLRMLYFLMAPACLGVEMTGGYNSTMLNGLQAVPSWVKYFHHPRSAALGLLVSMYSLGSVAAVPFVPSVVDRFGRRYPIMLGSVLSIFGGILQGCASNFTMFIVARFILGFASIFCIVAASSLIGELSHPNERAVMGCLFNNNWGLGGVAAAAVTFRTFAMPGNLGWRIPSILQAVLSLVQLSFIWLIPESPRWLVSNGRGDEAYAILVKYHAEGDENSEFVKAEYTQIEETLEAEMKLARMNQHKVLSMPGMRKRVIIATFLGLFVQWCGSGLIENFLAPILDNLGMHDNRTKNIVNLASFSWSFVNGTFSALIAPRYPRRTIYLTSSISVFVVFTAWTIASAEYSYSHSKTSAQVALALIFLYSLPCNLGFTALTFTYLVELFPFHARAMGITIYQWWCRAAGFSGQFMNPIGIDAAGWRFYIVYCVWNAFQVVFIYFVFPETSGRTLEELSFMYEGDQDASGHAEVERLCQDDAERYGTMAGHSRTARDAQG